MLGTRKAAYWKPTNIRCHHTKSGCHCNLDLCTPAIYGFLPWKLCTLSWKYKNMAFLWLKIWHHYHSIGMCRMWRFLAVLRSFYHSSLLCMFSCHPSPPTILPSSLTSSCHLFLGLPLNLDVPNSYIILFWEFYFFPFSVHAQTNVIYLTCCLCYSRFFNPCINFFIG